MNGVCPPYSSQGHVDALRAVAVLLNRERYANDPAVTRCILHGGPVFPDSPGFSGKILDR
jgi:hypothetical protein